MDEVNEGYRNKEIEYYTGDNVNVRDLFFGIRKLRMAATKQPIANFFFCLTCNTILNVEVSSHYNQLIRHYNMCHL